MMRFLDRMNRVLWLYGETKLNRRSEISSLEFARESPFTPCGLAGILSSDSFYLAMADSRDT